MNKDQLMRYCLECDGTTLHTDMGADMGEHRYRCEDCERRDRSKDSAWEDRM